MLGHHARESISYSLRSNIEKIIEYTFGCGYIIHFNGTSKDLNMHCAVVTFDCQEYGDFNKYKHDRSKLKEIEGKRYKQLKRRIKQLTGTFDEDRLYIDVKQVDSPNKQNEFNYALSLKDCLTIYNKGKNKYTEYKQFDTTDLDNVLVNKTKCIEFDQVADLSRCEKKDIEEFKNLIRYNSFGIKSPAMRRNGPIYSVCTYKDNDNYLLYFIAFNKYKDTVQTRLDDLMQNMFCIKEKPDVYGLHENDTVIQYSISKEDFINIITVCKVAYQSIQTLLTKENN